MFRQLRVLSCKTQVSSKISTMDVISQQALPVTGSSGVTNFEEEEFPSKLRTEDVMERQGVEQSQIADGDSSVKMMQAVVTGAGGEGGVGEDSHLPSCPTSGPTPVQQQEDCSLEETVDLKHREAEAGNTSASWRDESINDDSDEDEDDTDGEDDDDYSDEDEEAAEEWLKRYYMRQRGLPEVLASLPNTIKVSLVPETEEDRVRREQKQRDELGI